ncbi:Penicillin-binding protein A [Nostocoides japonicum T1-X7]|uniref:Penicillin-binding protein A n=1 Tax=Nostocoides japonicum T1-X7 TaxID=1194083 RepID=A0A077M903_9MICO|nr:penicillin-binding protein 2 [Tetrasphaera japonica]CCH80524.1 Penicillin-binding protein A [Tetrasphaera japonica T1-X7]
MNAPIRRLATVVAALFAALLISTTMIQFVFAKSINARPDNRRTLLSTFGVQRGQILADGKAVAESVPSDDEYKWQRKYTQAELYAHVTGYYSFLYGAGGGLEGSENDLLSGSSDKLFYQRISDLLTGKKPRGASLTTTIDAAAQRAAEEGLGNQRGAAIAIDPRTGAILAMVSHPSYDPNVLASHDIDATVKAWRTLTTDKSQPMVNRTIAGNLYPPGSTFKLVTAAAALSSGKFTPSSVLPGQAVLDLPGTTVGLPNDGHVPCSPTGKVTLTEALRVSCNPAFGQLGMDLGQDAVRAQAAKFGVGDELAVPMRVTPSVFPTGLNEAQLAQSSIGQFDVRMTPLQVAMISAAIANRGVVMKPYLVKSAIVDSELSVVDRAQPERLSEAVTPEVANELKSMMIGVVQGGTGTAAQIPGVEVAGKTGTAETAAGANPDAWFTGFAPANGTPKVAVAVIVEDGGNAGSEAAGGRVAGPIARDIMKAVLGE